MKVLYVLAALCLGTGAAHAVDKSAAAAEFNEFIEACAADPGDRSLDQCIEDQVDSQSHYLGDIVGEMTQYVTETAGKTMLKGQVAFEEYRRLTCSYEMEAHPEEKYAGLFCYHRLTSQRVEDVREGLEFATFR